MGREVRVLSAGAVAECSATRVDVEGLRLAVVRIHDDWYAVDDRCSHADYSLAEGEVWCEERELECWKHGSTFSLTTGEPQSLPATQPVATYPVRVDGDDVLVTLP